MNAPVSISSSPSPPPTSSQDKKRKRQSLNTQSSTGAGSLHTTPSLQRQSSTIPQMFAAQGDESKKRSRTSTSPTNFVDMTQGDENDWGSRSTQSGNARRQSAAAGKNNEVIDLTDTPSPRRPTETIDLSSMGSPTQPATNRQALRLGNKPKKMVVKFLKQRTEGDTASGEAYFNKTWDYLDKALQGIFYDKPLGTPMELLYRGSENICEGGKASLLYEKLKGRMEEYVRDSLRDEVSRDAPSKGVVVAVCTAWNKWKGQVGKILSIFYYLERKYLFSARDPKVRRVVPTGLLIFRLHVVSDPKFQAEFLDGVINLYLELRSKPLTSSEQTDELLRTCIEMLRELELYKELFEPRFFKEAAGLFRSISEEEVAKGDVASYIALICSLLESESGVCEKYRLETETRKHLLFELENEMVNRQTHFLASQGNFTKLAEMNDIRSLTMLYELLSRTGKPDKYIKTPWETYIVEYGKAIILDDTRDAQMISRLLLFKAQLDEILESAFQKNEDLGFALRESFKTFINHRRENDRAGSKVASLLAKHLDHLLRVGIKGLPKIYDGLDSNISKPKKFQELSGDSDAEMEAQFELSLEIFRFVASKDVFEAFYKKYLSKRLLLSKTASMDAERAMMAKLRNECGAGFTQNMESMFKDIERSKEMTVSFKQSRLHTFNADLHFDVLSSAAWPTYPEIPVVVPEELQKPLKAFEDYYTAAHKGRQLSWRHGNGHASLTARFSQATKELVVSVHQAIVLLLFNDIEEETGLDYSTLKSASGLPDDELQRTLQSLACGHYRVLIKKPKSKDVNPTDVFYFNSRFNDERQRIKINQIQAKETTQEKNETVEKVERDRQFETQAAICRVLKARKMLTEMELMEAVIEQTKGRGMLDVTEVRKNGDKLIEKDYIAKGDNNTIVYVI